MSHEESLYSNGRIYDAMNSSLVADTHFYCDELNNENGEILELACGTGRISCALAIAGKSITGLDISESMLTEAREKSKKLNLKIDWQLGDMTQFGLSRKFDAIFVGYNSVHHILNNQDLKKFLVCVRNHLKPEGKFYFDIFNPSLAFLMRPKARLEMDNYFDPATGEQIFVTEENIYDAATQVNHVTYYYSKIGQPDYRSHPLKLRCYFPQEIDAILDYSGFSIINKYGSFKKDVFVSDSMKQIFECRLTQY